MIARVSGGPSGLNDSSFLSWLQRNVLENLRANSWTTFTGWAHLLLFLILQWRLRWMVGRWMG